MNNCPFSLLYNGSVFRGEVTIKDLLAYQDNIYNFFINPYWNFNGNAKETLLKNHDAFMRKVEQYYWQRVSYWETEANRLIAIP